MFKTKRPDDLDDALHAENFALLKVGAIAEFVVDTADSDIVWRESALDQLADAVKELRVARDLMRAAIRH